MKLKSITTLFFGFLISIFSATQFSTHELSYLQEYIIGPYSLLTIEFAKPSTSTCISVGDEGYIWVYSAMNFDKQLVEPFFPKEYPLVVDKLLDMSGLTEFTVQTGATKGIFHIWRGENEFADMKVNIAGDVTVVSSQDNDASYRYLPGCAKVGKSSS